VSKKYKILLRVGSPIKASLSNSGLVIGKVENKNGLMLSG